ncbi:MAG: outer membrane beta-barrel protein [Bacteroidota bacterium]
MRTFLVLSAMCLLFVSGHTQSMGHFGFLIKRTHSTHLFKFPNKPFPEKGYFSFLPEYGFGFYLEIAEHPYLRVRPQLNYHVKGFNHVINYTPAGGGPNQMKTLANRFHYGSWDLLAQVHSRGRGLSPYLILGFRGDFLLKKETESEELWKQAGHELESYQTYRPYSFGAVAGAGIEIMGGVRLECEGNLDVLQVVRQRDLLVRNAMWSVNLGINLDRFFPGSTNPYASLPCISDSP